MHHESNRAHVLFFDAIDETHVGAVGGKGAHLAALSRIEGVRVPAGFCVTTDAFDRIVLDAAIDDALARLARVNADDREAIAALSAEARNAIEATRIPRELANAITRAVARLVAPHATTQAAPREQPENACPQQQPDPVRL